MLPLGSILIPALILVSGRVVSAATGIGSMGGSQLPAGMMDRQSVAPVRSHMLTIGQAAQRVRRYTARYGNPHLVVDEVLGFQQNFYAIVKDTSTGHGAFEVLVDKWTGAVFPEYGPAMMWNTQYGMMTGGMGSMMGYGQSRGPMTVTPTRARQIAQLWLNRYRAGSTTEAPDRFPGYYTIHFLQYGSIAGMLSVNGYTGTVWYHSWHGKFIASTHAIGGATVSP
jgi:hypothetical protein